MSRSYRWQNILEVLWSRPSTLTLLLQFRETEWRKAVEPGAVGKKRTSVLLRLVLVRMDAREYIFHVSQQGTVGTKSASTIVVLALSRCRSKWLIHRAGNSYTLLCQYPRLPWWRAQISIMRAGAPGKTCFKLFEISNGSEDSSFETTWSTLGT